MVVEEEQAMTLTVVMNTEEEVDYAVEKLKAAVTRFRRLGSFR